jgi:hypothetical protein
MNAVACWNPDLSEEDRQKIIKQQEREKVYINSWENNEKAGFGSPRTRSPNEKTDFNNLKYTLYDWDFVFKDKEQDVYYIPGFPHTYHRGENCLYFVPRGEKPNYNNLKPFDSEWEPVSWIFEIENLKNIRMKWDEYRTSNSWIGRIYRNIKTQEHHFHTVNGNTQEDAVMRTLYAINQLKSHPLNFQERGWDKKCVGRKIYYHSMRCVISHVNFGFGETRFFIEGDNKEKIIPAPIGWQSDNADDICNRQQWYGEYAKGLYAEWDSKNIDWSRQSSD